MMNHTKMQLLSLAHDYCADFSYPSITPIDLIDITPTSQIHSLFVTIDCALHFLFEVHEFRCEF